MDDRQARELARNLRDGKADAWQTLYEAYAERVWRSVARLLGPHTADVADVVQETFLAAARSTGAYDPDRGSPWTWLWSIGRRQVALHFRKRGRQDPLRAAAGNGRLAVGPEGREPEPSAPLEAAELAGLVRAALVQLPADYEGLLTARYLDGVPVEQLAEQERSTVTAVRSKLARARDAFRHAFRQYAGFATSPARGRHEPHQP
jgi:RNA polymerase sigma-70 factor (ECF subfamily)